MLAEFSLDSRKDALAFYLANSTQEKLFLLFVIHWSDLPKVLQPLIDG